MRHKVFIFATWLILPFAVSMRAHSQEAIEKPPKPFYEEKEEGWFWKKTPPEPPVIKPQKPLPKPPEVVVKPSPAPVEKKDESKKPFSVAWLRKNMQILMDRAIDEPTPENIAAYMYAQRVAMDKSQVFAEGAQRVVLSDPFLDENNRASMATFGRMLTMQTENAAKETILKRLTKVSGLWFFYDSECSYCVDMADTMINFQAAYGFNTKFVSMDGRPIKGIKNWVKDQGQAKKLELTITPSLVMVVPPDGYYIISQGIMAMSDIADRILIAAENQNMLSQAEIRALHPSRNGLLTAQDTSDGATTDPVELVKNIRTKILGGSYGIKNLSPASP